MTIKPPTRRLPIGIYIYIHIAKIVCSVKVARSLHQNSFILKSFRSKICNASQEPSCISFRFLRNQMITGISADRRYNLPLNFNKFTMKSSGFKFFFKLKTIFQGRVDRMNLQNPFKMHNEGALMSQQSQFAVKLRHNCSRFHLAPISPRRSAGFSLDVCGSHSTGSDDLPDPSFVVDDDRELSSTVMK